MPMGVSAVSAPDRSPSAFVRFCTSDCAPRERLEAWREIYGRTLLKLDIEPNSDNNFIHDNLYHENGRHPAKTYLDQKIPGGDLAWDGTGTGNGWQEGPGVKAFPPELPKESGIEATEISAQEKRDQKQESTKSER